MLPSESQRSVAELHSPATPLLDGRKKSVEKQNNPFCSVMPEMYFIFFFQQCFSFHVYFFLKETPPRNMYLSSFSNQQRLADSNLRAVEVNSFTCVCWNRLCQPLARIQESKRLSIKVMCQNKRVHVVLDEERRERFTEEPLVCYQAMQIFLQCQETVLRCFLVFPVSCFFSFSVILLTFIAQPLAVVSNQHNLASCHLFVLPALFFSELSETTVFGPPILYNVNSAHYYKFLNTPLCISVCQSGQEIH